MKSFELVAVRRTDPDPLDPTE